MNSKEQAAMQQALEALEELHYSSGTVIAAKKYESATAALREALAVSEQRTEEQAEQEPVADKVLRLLEPFMPQDASPVRTKDPCHPWQDLTDDEIHKLVKQVRFDGMTDRTFQFARAVIAADREKNK